MESLHRLSVICMRGTEDFTFTAVSYTKINVMRQPLFANLSCEIQMEFTAEHRTFVVNGYLRTVGFIGGIYRYNVRVYVDEFLLAYPQFQQISREKLCEGFTGTLPSFGSSNGKYFKEGESMHQSERNKLKIN
ncbi:hypothetical protein C0J52_25834 [Blattella germanica]|nr:hypothetical protein C0J52_25834 [Blattella germanica]